jgi:hypothetical protein
MPQGSTDHFFGRYRIPVGVSVIRKATAPDDQGFGEGPYGFGGYERRPYPALIEIADLEEGVDWFQGGRSYIVSDEIAENLVASGFEVTPDVGYGESVYGSQGFGV